MIAKPKLFCDTVARWDGRHWWLVNHPEKGFSSSGRAFDTLDQIREAYDVEIGNESTDQFGTFVPVKRR